jgi:hypothetical protein
MPTTYVAVHPTTGAHLRAATAEELERFWTGQTHPRVKRGEHLWTRAVRVDDVLIDTDNGPGAWHGGAGF